MTRLYLRSGDRVWVLEPLAKVLAKLGEAIPFAHLTRVYWTGSGGFTKRHHSTFRVRSSSVLAAEDEGKVQ